MRNMLLIINKKTKYHDSLSVVDIVIIKKWKHLTLIL